MIHPFVQPLVGLLQKHPKRIMGSLGVLLLGTGVTAFGVAPLAPDAADLPVRQVLESIEPASRLVQSDPAEAQAALPFVLFRSDLTRRDDSAQSLLQRLGVNDSEAAAFLRSDAVAKQLFSGRAGKLVSAETTDRHGLQRLTARWTTSDDARDFERLVIERDGAGWRAQLSQAPLAASARLAGGVITSSLFAATDRVNLPDSVAIQLAEIFSADIDFRRDLRRDDRFSLVYETLEADGEVIRTGRILSAEFINNRRQLRTLWFQAPGEKGGYFDFDGQSQRRVYLSSPLEFTRVSSGYGMRFHPIRGQRRPHLGVDFAAPTGTPVRTVGDGLVAFAGWQGGYGNVVYVEHRNKQTTVYAHLSRIHVSKGQRVEQGQKIGAVGSTGASTGPHLHFEFRDKGVHIDPLTVARTGDSVAVSPSSRKAFDTLAASMRQQLAAAATVELANAE